MHLVCDERQSDSPYIERIWHSRSDYGGSFVSVAEAHAGMVVTKYRGQMFVTVRGPETRPTPAYCPDDADFFGIQFKYGTYMPDFPVHMLRDRCDANLPQAAGQSFWLKGSAWQFPSIENVETFINWLVRDGLLVHDPLVAGMLKGHPVDTSLRTAQRRFLQATGLTQTTILQIKRARSAAILLKQGYSILDAVHQAGYADQPHMTRSLKHFLGYTPAQLVAQNIREPMSFLFKTEPF